jgi:hypothetical protein
MRSITGTLTPQFEAQLNGATVARSDAFPVASFRELVEHVARLSYLNKDHLLFFRGQARDFRNKANSTTVYPTIYRGERVPREQLDLSFSVLETASVRLCDMLEREGVGSHRDVRRRRYIQWSILQHYEVCATPLLDLTHSLRVACSFAFLSKNGEDPYVFLFGLPYLTNRISVNSEHDLVNIRLLSICPPEALRPHFQEGYLAGTDEILMDFGSKSELDFNNRLIAKFRLMGGRSGFFTDGFRPYPRRVLYPPNDRILELCQRLKGDVGTGLSAGRIGSFLEQWTMLEARIMEAVRQLAQDHKVYSMRSALDLLRTRELCRPELLEQLNRLRRTRNEVVHRPSRVETADVVRATVEMRDLLIELRENPPWAS